MTDNKSQHDINIDQTGLKKGEKLIIRRDEKGRVTEIEKRDACWVVTACYGEKSHELLYVTKACRKRFATNPLMMASWYLYRKIGHRLAVWADANEPRRVFAKTILARPIYEASKPASIKSLAARIYLLGLSVLGAVTVVPVLMLEKAVTSIKHIAFNKAN